MMQPTSVNHATEKQDANLGHATDVANPATHWLLNAAFLQEIKDSNPHLWHQAHDLRVLCQLDCDAREHPQATVKRFAECLSELRDLLALQFSLEESYGLISSFPDGDVPRPQSVHQEQIVQMTLQHGRLYLQVVDLVEQAEELQYRGCDLECLLAFGDKAMQFSNDLTAHERFESELIRISQEV